MKPGLRKLLLAVALLAAGYLAFFDQRASDDGTVVEATSGNGTPQTTTKRTQEGDTEILALRRRSANTTRADALFTAPPPPKPVVPSPPPPPPPPQAPPLPFTYVGKRLDGARWEVFITRGAETLIVHENETVDGTYRIESIKPPQMVWLYLPLSQRQSLNIGAAE